MPPKMAIPGGLEPPTCSLEVSCSIQLSYGTDEAVIAIFTATCPVYMVIP